MSKKPRDTENNNAKQNNGADTLSVSGMSAETQNPEPRKRIFIIITAIKSKISAADAHLKSGIVSAFKWVKSVTAAVSASLRRGITAALTALKNRNKKGTPSPAPDVEVSAVLEETPENIINAEESSAALKNSDDAPYDTGAQASGDITPPADKKGGRKRWSLKKKIIVGFSGAVAACIIGAGIWLLVIISDPLSSFETIFNQISPPPSEYASENVSPSASESAEPSATATLDAFGQLIAQGDAEILKKSTNILLIGVDYAPERDTWNGKHTYHADVMIVLSINRDTNKISLISLPRDTYGQIPGVKGIYKLNASLNCGGEWPSLEACEKVREAASWMIGNLPIQCYFAVDMTAVIDLVNSIGGVDYDLDIAFKMGGGTRVYAKGLQHMDGQGVLDYLRVRHDSDIEGSNGGDVGDKARVIRQKNMLKAIFEKIKGSDLLLQIPNLVSTFDSTHLVTNATFKQLVSLVAISRIVDNDVQVFSMSGIYTGSVFGDSLGYSFTDNKNRANIMNTVYGININDKATKKALNIPNYSAYDYESSIKLGLKMRSYVTLGQANKMLKKHKGKLDADALLPPTPAPETPPEEQAAGPYRVYANDGKEWTLYNKCTDECNNLNNGERIGDNGQKVKLTYAETDKLIKNIQNDIGVLCGYLSVNVPRNYWVVILNTFYGKINQPYVKNEVAVDPS